MLLFTETGGYKKQKTINRKQTVSIKKTGLKKGNTYYFKVRAYKNVNGKKIYGSFSNIRKVKITK